MIVYCDSSVLLKRVFDEADAAEFRSHFQDLIDGGSALATSALGELEVSRVCRRYFGDDGLRDARAAKSSRSQLRSHRLAQHQKPAVF